MPKLKDFKEKKNSKKYTPSEEDLNLKADIAADSLTEEENEQVPMDFEEVSAASPRSSRRRPGTERVESTPASESPEEETVTTSSQEETQTEMDAEKKKVDLNFYGQEWVKEKAPSAYRSLEIIADDWVNDGKFEGLPVGHPLLQFLASKGLQKAKNVEKRLEEKGVFFLARTGVELAKMKVEELRKKLK